MVHSLLHFNWFSPSAAVLYFLLQVSFLVDEGVSPVLLQLLSCALCGSKVLATSSSSSASSSGGGGGSGGSGQAGGSQPSQTKSSSKKSKKEDKEKDKDGEETTQPHRWQGSVVRAPSRKVVGSNPWNCFLQTLHCSLMHFSEGNIS